MFNFLKRKKATINSISIPDFGWEQVKKETEMQQWINPVQSIALSINFFDQKPDLPTVTDVGILRDYYRNQIVAHDGGLIQTDLIDLKTYSVIKTIFKIPQDPMGITYLASLTIPFKNCSYVVKIQAAEVGTTGMRDTLVTNELLTAGKISFGEDGFENWFADPYDPSFKEGTRMNLSEEIAYDAMFPEHPLSQARSLIARIKAQIVFGEELGKLKQFGK
jgi:hypothetical protein